MRKTHKNMGSYCCLTYKNIGMVGNERISFFGNCLSYFKKGHVSSRDKFSVVLTCKFCYRLQEMHHYSQVAF